LSPYIEPTELRDYLAKVFPHPKRKKGQTERSYNIAVQKVEGWRNDATTLFAKGKGNDLAPVRGTLWAAYNAVVELIDHHWTYQDPWQRFQSVCFGEGAKYKQEAFDVAFAMIQTAA
jgi:hypothetical protein